MTKYDHLPSASWDGFGSTAAFVGVLLAASVLAATWCLVAAPTPTPTPEQTVARMSVKLSDDTGHGSGVIIGKNLVLTNRHVALALGENITVTMPGGWTRAGKPLSAGVRDYDLALVEVDTGDAPAATIDCAQAPVGEHVFSYGNPLRLTRIMTWGRIAGDPIADQDPPQIRDATPMDLVINPGNSGGGVWAVHEGRPVLVGLSTAVVLTPLGGFSASLSGISLMIPSTVICRFLARR